MTDLAPTQVQPGASVSGLEPGAEGVRPPTDPDRRGVFLTDVIVELGFADEEQIELAERASRESEVPIERVLVDNGTLDAQQLACAVAERNGLDLVDLESFDVDMEAAALIGRTMAERYDAVPIAYASDGALIVAVQDVFDTLGVSDIEVQTRCEVRRVVVVPAQLQALIEGLPKTATQLPPPPAPAPETETAAEPEPPADEQPVGEPDIEPEFEPEPLPEPVAEAEPPVSELVEEPAEASVQEEPPAAPVEEEPTQPAVDEESPESLPEPVITPMEEETMQAQPFEPMQAQPFEPVVDVSPEPESETAAPQSPPIASEAAPAPLPSDDELADLTAELRALRDTAARADALAVRVGDRIEALEGAADRADRLEREEADREERIAQLQRDLDAAKATSAELEGKLAGVGDAAQELNAATETLQALQRALEQTAR